MADQIATEILLRSRTHTLTHRFRAQIKLTSGVPTSLGVEKSNFRGIGFYYLLFGVCVCVNIDCKEKYYMIEFVGVM